MDALYEAGCDDATFGVSDGVTHAAFDREAPSLDAAVLSAISDVERAGGRVIRIDIDDLVSIADVAERYGRTAESVRLLIAGDRGPGGFPPSATHPRSRTRLWHWPDVRPRFATELGEKIDGLSTLDEAGAGDTLAAVNGALAWRAHRAAWTSQHAATSNG